MGKTMSFSEKDRLFILVHGEDTPADPEWDAYLAALGKHSHEIPSVRVLVVSRGGGPNMAQRKRLKTLLGTTPLPTAVITSSQIARAIVTIIRLTSPEIAAFSPEHRPEAYAHLRFEPADREWLDSRVAEVERELA